MKFRQSPLHHPWATGVVASPGVIAVYLSFERNPGVPNGIKFRGIRRDSREMSYCSKKETMSFAVCM